MQNGHDLALQFRFQVDQHVPAGDKVHLREGRSLSQIVFGKDTKSTHARTYTISCIHLGEEPSQALRRNFLRDAFWIDCSTGLVDAGLAYVSAEKLDLDTGRFVPQEF